MSGMIHLRGCLSCDPVRREVHRHGFYKSSLSTNVEMSVSSRPSTLNFITFARGRLHARMGVSATEFLGGLVALRQQEGWVMVSMTDTVAVLKKAG
jgi:hypothetical protein